LDVAVALPSCFDKLSMRGFIKVLILSLSKDEQRRFFGGNLL
jgi:hypothetical protein